MRWSLLREPDGSTIIDEDDGTPQFDVLIAGRGDPVLTGRFPELEANRHADWIGRTGNIRALVRPSQCPS